MNSGATAVAQAWTSDRLCAATAAIYRATGFTLHGPGSAPEPIIFVSTKEGDPTPIAVGCLAVPAGKVVTSQEVQSFCQTLGAHNFFSGVFVTNGAFEAAAVQIAQNLPLLLIDQEGLMQALQQIPQAQRDKFLNPATPVEPPQPAPAAFPIPAAFSTSETPSALAEPHVQAVSNNPNFPKSPAQSTPENCASAPSQQASTNFGSAIQTRARHEKPQGPAAPVGIGAPSGVAQEAKAPDPVQLPPEMPQVGSPLANGIAMAVSQKSQNVCVQAAPLNSVFQAVTPSGPASSVLPSSAPPIDQTGTGTSETPTFVATSSELNGIPSMNWEKPPGNKPKIGNAIATGVVIFLIAVGAWVGWTSFPNERAQIMAWIQSDIIHPVLNPIDEAPPPTSDQLASASSSNSSENSPVAAKQNVSPLQRKLVHRVTLLEALKERVQAEQLASEVYMLSQFPKSAGTNFVDLAGGDLEETVRLVCEIDSSQPRLDEADQERVLPYLKIEKGILLNVSPSLDVDAMLKDETSIAQSNPLRGYQCLSILERRMYVEDAIAARRHAQSIAAVVSAAQATGIDFVSKSDSNLDKIIAAVVAGETINDQDSPFNGHIFKTPSPSKGKEEEIKQFLRVTNGRLRYHENLPEELKRAPQFSSADDPEELRKASELAEQLVRGTAAQILVNRANRDKTLMPVRGL